MGICCDTWGPALTLALIWGFTSWHRTRFLTSLRSVITGASPDQTWENLPQWILATGYSVALTKTCAVAFLLLLIILPSGELWPCLLRGSWVSYCFTKTCWTPTDGDSLGGSELEMYPLLHSKISCAVHCLCSSVSLPFGTYLLAQHVLNT